MRFFDRTEEIASLHEILFVFWFRFIYKYSYMLEIENYGSVQKLHHFLQRVVNGRYVVPFKECLELNFVTLIREKHEKDL